MNKSSKLLGVGLAGAISLCAVGGAAFAGSITQPGELVGYGWAPLPEGIYFADTGSYGNDRGVSYNSALGVNIPVMVWSTPWTFFNGRIEAYVAIPSVSLGANNFDGVPGSSLYVSALYNPALLVGEAWDFGNGWNFAQFFGGYAPVNNALNQNFFTFNSRTAITYNADNWNITAHGVLGITGNNNTAQGTFQLYGQKTSPNYFNLDLTAAKTFDKWTFGVVGFGSWDISGVTDEFPGLGLAYPVYHKQSQFAVGGLIGYNFGPVVLQTYVTRDIASSNYLEPIPTGFGGFYTQKVYETRWWGRLIVPLWTAPAPAPVVAKY